MNLKGIGEKTAALFSKLNIENTEDLIKFFPRDYSFYSPAGKIKDIKAGEICAVKATCLGDATIRTVRGLSIVTARVSDGEDTITVVYFNMPYIRSALKRGEEKVFRGQVIQKGNTLSINQPKLFKPDDYAKLENTWQPIYTTTKGLSTGAVQKAVNRAIEYEKSVGINDVKSPLYDHIPEFIRKKRSLIGYSDAVLGIHLPIDWDMLVDARQRLVYQEFYDFIYNIEISRDKNHRYNPNKMIDVSETVRMIESLPYELTTDQISVWNDIRNDLTSEHGLLRLVQGDVGSGKTIIAILSIVFAVANGYQAALMAPTEVLASQHFDTINQILKANHLKFQTALMTGSVKGKERKELLSSIASGECKIIIGTHALFQEKVEYNKLGLVITDEQHRFGVLQREALKDKGLNPHVLIMSATPIPRTLAMILYGDLDVSSIHTMPVGRTPIKNCVVDTKFRTKAYEFVVNEVNKGHQVYIICPQVESGELPGVENVTDYTTVLKSTLPENIRIECLHGKMKPSRKEEIMNNMAAGNIDVLVSTTVIEVGVNVPNATLMYIENAERFGLAQLHQLRGRVGRSDIQSFCIFMMGNATPDAEKRLNILLNSNDGFEIAREDMKLRGPGDIFGIRQSGEMNFVLGDIYQDADLIVAAAEDVKEVLSMDDFD